MDGMNPLYDRTVMREAAVVLPAARGDMEVSHETTLEKLTEAFGGWSMFPSIGGWRDPETGETVVEPNVTITVAMLPTAENNDKLDIIAREFGAATDQKAVYVRHADGVVSILPIVAPVVVDARGE